MSPRADDGGLDAPRRRFRFRSLPGLALTLMAAGVAALVLLLPSVSDACQPSLSSAGRQAERALASGSDVLIIGDSYTTGRGSSTGTYGWAQMLSARSGWHSTIDGRPGTGYVATGASGRTSDTYLPRIRALADTDPALVIIQGSQNDRTVGTARLRRAVKRALEAAKRQWPDAVIVAIGPSAPEPLAATTIKAAAAVEDAAEAAGVHAVDPADEHWFTTVNSRTYAATDGEHLDDAGYRYLADRVDGALRGLVTTTADCRAT